MKIDLCFTEMFAGQITFDQESLDFFRSKTKVGPRIFLILTFR